MELQTRAEIFVNGQTRPLVAGTTVATLLDELGLTHKFVAVEVNLELVPRGQHAVCPLRTGDQVEIVTLVGGG